MGEWWFEVSLEWTVQPLVPISLMSFQGMGSGSLLQTFLARPETTSLYWYTVRFDTEGEFLWNLFHSHNQWHKKTWVFVGTPEDLGLNRGAFVLPPLRTKCEMDHWDESMKCHHRADWIPIQAVDLNALGMSIGAVENHLFRNLKSANAADRLAGTVVKCRIRTMVECMRGADSECYDRLSTTQCRPWRFRTGDSLTLVTFNIPSSVEAAREALPSGLGFMQHAIFRGIYSQSHKHTKTRSAGNITRESTFSATPQDGYKIRISLDVEDRTLGVELPYPVPTFYMGNPRGGDTSGSEEVTWALASNAERVPPGCYACSFRHPTNSRTGPWDRGNCSLDLSCCSAAVKAVNAQSHGNDMGSKKFHKLIYTDCTHCAPGAPLITAAQAQRSHVEMVGWLAALGLQKYTEALLQAGLKDLGYIAGKSVTDLLTVEAMTREDARQIQAAAEFLHPTPEGLLWTRVKV